MISEKQHDVLIIVPAFNEAWIIESLVKDVKAKYPDCDVLVVNDASEDDTGFIAESTGLCNVLNFPANLGIGGAVQAGFKYAKRHNYKFAVQLDGDGQHLPEFIPRILRLLELNKADVVIGTRFSRKKTDGFQSTFLRRMGIRFFRLVSFVLAGMRVSDCTSGFRAYNKNAIKFLSRNYPSDFPEPEAIILLGKNKFRVKEVSVKMLDRKGGRSSITHRGWFYMIKVLLAMFMASIRPKIYKHD